MRSRIIREFNATELVSLQQEMTKQSSRLTLNYLPTMNLAVQNFSFSRQLSVEHAQIRATVSFRDKSAASHRPEKPAHAHYRALVYVLHEFRPTLSKLVSVLRLCG